ncbi:MAG: ferrochelatase [Planctomycetota bacterium]|nr:ferrochelatase [Planctomycetota bacterium]
MSYDAILLVSFGGPEGRDDVLPFLENVTRGRNIPPERLLEVAEHYYHFDGVSPINQQCRELIAALRSELDRHEIKLPIYWGNRNWDPLLPEVLQKMKDDGVQHALAFVTAAFSSWSSCRQYRENIAAAQQLVGDGAPEIDKLRVFYNHPHFVAANVKLIQQSLDLIPADRREKTHLAFTAHSIPQSMSDSCDYLQQLTESCQLVTEELRIPVDRWRLVFQSRSGRPQDPWLEPDICDHLAALKESGTDDVVVVPIGFLSDHMEVLFDLDCEAMDACNRIGLNMVRAGTVGTHPEFVSMIRRLIEERIAGVLPEAIGQFGPSHNQCPAECCPGPQSSKRTISIDE